MLIDQICVSVENGELEEDKIRYCIEHIKQCAGNKQLKSLTFYMGENFVDLRYSFYDFPLERIRRMDAFILCPTKCCVVS